MSGLAVVRSWFDAFAAGNEPRARERLADDAVLVTDDAKLRGFDELREWYGARISASPSFSYELDELFDTAGGAVVALLTLSDSTRSRRQVAVYEVARSRISEIRLYEER